MARKYSTCFRSQRVRVCPDWSNLHTDLLGKIFNGLHAVDKLSFKSVCRPWRILANAEIKSFLSASVRKSPLLVLPGDQGHLGKSGCMFSLDDESFMPVKMPLESHILGACRGGWLLLVKMKTNLVLWNALLDVQIHLPSDLTFPCVKSDSQVSEDWITKAVLFGSDPISSSDCGVVAFYGGGKLAFVKYGDCRWSDLGSANQEYCDVTCFKDSLLALSHTAKLEVWNFSTSVPRKTMEIILPFPQDMPESEEPLRDKYMNQFYILESQGSVLLVVRWIGNFVDPDGVLRTEDDLLEEDDDPSSIYPYLTMKFYVYKLDSDSKRWVHLENLGNQALFLGRNQSVSFHAEDFARCKKNSIYFTDDYWDLMDEDDCYGGHDMGIFSLEDGSIEPIYCCGLDNISPPVWVLPNAVVDEDAKQGQSAI